MQLVQLVEERQHFTTKNGKMVVSQIFFAIKFTYYCLKDAPHPSVFCFSDERFLLGRSHPSGCVSG